MADSGFSDEHTPDNPEEAHSLDLVQRLVASVLVAAIIASIVIVLLYFLATSAPQELPRDSIVGLWVMSGVLGLMGTGIVLALHGRKILHPLLLIGLLPMVVSWYWIIR